MPVLGELGVLPNVLSNSLIAQSHLWKREVSTIKQLDLLVFLYQYKGTSQYGQACREVNTVTDAGAEALIAGDVETAEFVFFEFPKVAFTSDEFSEWLSAVSEIRQKALLFALEMDMDPKAVIGLEWRDLRKLQLTPIANELAKGMMRHFSLKYVFWDFLSNGSAAPLFGLAESALEVSQGLGFEVLRGLYKRMVIIDTEANLADCLHRICQELEEGAG